MSDFVEQVFLKISNEHQFHWSKSTIESLGHYFEIKELKKGDFWLREGQYCRQTVLVEKGLFMYYHLVDGEEVALDFAVENDWVSYIKSINQNIPSDIYIRALEDCIIHSIDINTMDEVFKEYPSLIQIKLLQVEKSFMDMAIYNANLNSLTVEEHYQHLTETRKEWLSRVPQYYIASYLGIKPQSLSRIRKRISKQKMKD